MYLTQVSKYALNRPFVFLIFIFTCCQDTNTRQGIFCLRGRNPIIKSQSLWTGLGSRLSPWDVNIYMCHNMDQISFIRPTSQLPWVSIESSGNKWRNQWASADRQARWSVLTDWPSCRKFGSTPIKFSIPQKLFSISIALFVHHRANDQKEVIIRSELRDALMKKKR